MNVLKVAVPRHPSVAWPQASLGTSVILLTLPHPRVHDFLSKLSLWLPSSQFSLLYRGSRQGLSAAMFHAYCDGKARTLTLIQGQSKDEPVCVFGGYASAPWEKRGGYVDAPDSFLFSVLNPFGDDITKFPVDPSSPQSSRAMFRSDHYGPCFGSGNVLWVRSESGSPLSPFDGSSSCSLRAKCTYRDMLGRGSATFTGARDFVPLEVEVWLVTGC